MAKIPKRAYLMPDVILKMLIKSSPDDKALINQKKCKLVVSSFALYEALMCIQKSDKVNWKNLRALMNTCEFVFDLGIKMGYKRKILLRQRTLKT